MNLENLAFFATFGSSSNWASGAAVAVGMGKPAFCAGFQAPRRGVGSRHKSTINPSERHFHSETLDFQGFGKILSFLSRSGPNVGPSESHVIYMFFQILAQSPKKILEINVIG